MSENKFLQIVNAVSPSFSDLRRDVSEFLKTNKNKSKNNLASMYANRIRKKYTTVGVASALPSVVPGLGTTTQVFIEISSLSGDVALMLRWMASICYGIALIYDKDIENEFNQEFVKVLGIWCGVIKTAKEATKRVVTKVAVVQFNKNVSSKVISKINQKVGTTILTKYGTKRGGIALGKLVPFGVGAIISGIFNYSTMSAFKKAAIDYYSGGCFEILEDY